jgi:hypothetical protein
MSNYRKHYNVIYQLWELEQRQPSSFVEGATTWQIIACRETEAELDREIERRLKTSTQGGGRMSETMTIEPGTKIYVESFGVTRHGAVIRQIDSNHVELTIDDYPGNVYTAAIKDIQLRVSEIHVKAPVHNFQSMHGTDACWHCDSDYGQHVTTTQRRT